MNTIHVTALIEEARRNLAEAIEGFFETASEAEIRDSLHGEVDL